MRNVNNNPNFNWSIKNKDIKDSKRNANAQEKESKQDNKLPASPLSAASYGIILNKRKNPSFGSDIPQTNTQKEEELQESLENFNIKTEDDKQYSKLVELYNYSYSEDEYYESPQYRYTRESYENYKFNFIRHSIEMTKLDEPYYQQCLDLLKICHDHRIAISTKASLLNETQKARAVKLSQSNYNYRFKDIILAGNDVQFEIAFRLLDDRHFEHYSNGTDLLLELSEKIGKDEETGKKFISLYDKFYSSKNLNNPEKTFNNLYEFAQLNDEQYKKVTGWLEKGISEEDIFIYLKHNATDEQIERYETIKTECFSEKAEQIAFNNDIYSRYIKLKQDGVSNADQIAIDDNKYKEYIEEKNRKQWIIRQTEDTDLSDNEIEELSKLDSSKREKLIQLYKEGYIPSVYLSQIAQMNDETLGKIIYLIKQGISAFNALNNIKYDDSEDDNDMPLYSDIVDVINKNDNTDIINIICSQRVKINDTTIARMSYIYDKIMSSPENLLNNLMMSYLPDILESDEEIYKKIVGFIELGAKDIDTIYEFASSKNENTYKKALELFKEGFQEDDISTLADIEDETQLEKTKELMKKYSISGVEAKYISELSGNDYQKALKLINLGVKTMIKNFLMLPDKVFDDVVMLIEDGENYENLLSDIYNFDEKKEGLKSRIKQNKQNNKKWKEFVSTPAFGDKYKKISDKKDIFFLKTHAFDSKYYTPEEYTDAFLYFKNLKINTGENILGCETFMNKIKKGGLGDFSAQSTNIMYNNIEQLLNINPASVNASYIQSLLEFMQNGTVNPSALRKLSDLNELKSIEEMLIGFGSFSDKSETSHWVISNNLKNDIDIIYEAIADNKNKTNLEKECKDKYIPTYKDEADGLKNSKTGDAFIIDGEKYIKIKTDENKAETVKLTKETYARLFPPVERFLTSQQTMGNCYCIETLMSMYCDNRTRINLLQLMEEDNDGNIKIKIGNYNPVIFKNGKLPPNEPEEIYSSGADGYKLFEYAYSCALVEDKIKETEQKIPADKLPEFRNFIKNNPNNFFIYQDNNQIKWTTYMEAVEKELYKKNLNNPFGANPYKTFNNFLLGNGGMQYDVYKKFGYKSDIYMGGLQNTSKKEIIEQFNKQGINIDKVESLDKIKRLLKNPEFFTNNQIQIGLGAHAYSLTQEPDKNGITSYYLYNPHNQGFPIKFENLNDLFKKVSQVIVLKLG